MRWGILGAGVISAAFASAVRRATDDVVVVVGARDPERRRAFARENGIAEVADYRGVLDREDIDAVYVGTIHPAHAALTSAAIEVGKAVLCEKPLAVSAAETAHVVSLARGGGTPLVEAFKYRFGPLWTTVGAMVQSGEIGDVVAVESGFGFAAPSRSGRLFDPAAAGGAILDAGCYPVSLVVGVAAWIGEAIPRLSDAEGRIGDTGVDEQASAVLRAGGVTATVRTSITQELSRTALIRGTGGVIEISNVWGSRAQSGDRVILRRPGRGDRDLVVTTVDPMAAEARAVADAVKGGNVEVPEIPWRESLAVAQILEDWRAALS